MTDNPTVNLKSIKSSYMTLADSASESLQKAILDGTFPFGSQLPPEVELVQALGVSRTTLREALKRLEEQGLIIRRRGLGTFVRDKTITKDLSVNFGITEMIKEGGQTPGTKWINIKKMPVDDEPAKALGIKEGSDAIIIERVRTANNIPVVFTIDYLPVEIFGEKQIEKSQLLKKSLYQFLYDENQIKIVHGLAKIAPLVAPSDLAEKLNIKIGSPLLKITQIDFSIEEKPVLFSIEYHLHDAFVFMVNRKGSLW